MEEKKDLNLARQIDWFRLENCLLKEEGEIIKKATVLSIGWMYCVLDVSPRMTEDLKEIGLDIGHRRVGCLMRKNAQLQGHNGQRSQGQYLLDPVG